MKTEPNNIIVFSLDTSSKNCSLAISKGKLILTEYNFITGDKLTSVLIPAIEFVLNATKLKMEDIDLFGIGIGPGLFTGIRIGLSTIKGLLIGKETPVVPVVTLKATAYKYNKINSLMIALIDAKRDELYIAGYEILKNEIKEILAPDLININELPSKLKGYSDYHFVGDGVEVHKDYLKIFFPGNKHIQRSSFLASEIGKIAHDRYLRNQYITNLQDLKPFYLKKPDAEKSNHKSENKNKKSQHQ